MNFVSICYDFKMTCVQIVGVKTYLTACIIW
jgi:hypothetical protein